MQQLASSSSMRRKRVTASQPREHGSTTPRAGSVRWLGRCAAACLAACLMAALAGCTFNWLDRGTPIGSIPPQMRAGRGIRTGPANLAMFASRTLDEHILGPRDVVGLYVRGLERQDEYRPIPLRVQENGTVILPLAGPTTVSGMTLFQAERAIGQAYRNAYLKDPYVRLELLQPRAKRVVVLGEVKTPGVYDLPFDQTDVLHALAKAGGLTERAETQVQIHRRVTDVAGRDQFMKALGFDDGGDRVTQAQATIPPNFEFPTSGLPGEGDSTRVITVPLRGTADEPIDLRDLSLEAGDVVMVESRRDEIFYVGGAVEHGGKFDLPRDREIDVLGAVAMAGGARLKSDPSKATVIRRLPDGRQVRVAMDLRRARRDPNQNIYLRPGDVVIVDEDLMSYFRELLKDSLRLSFDLGGLMNVTND